MLLIVIASALGVGISSNAGAKLRAANQPKPDRTLCAEEVAISVVLLLVGATVVYFCALSQ